MSYIGQQLPADIFSGYTTDSFTGDGSATTFTLSKAPFSEDALIVVINNVIQKPVTNFTVSGTTLTIVGTAVASGDVIYAMHTSGAVPSTLASKVDVNGVSDAIILDADADTTISADTDDQIDFKAGNTDTMHILNGDVRIGTATSFGPHDAGLKVKGDITIGDFTADSASATLGFIKSRNTTVGSQTIVANDDEIGRISFRADDGNDANYNNNVAAIAVQIDAAPGTDDTGGRIMFETTADGARATTERMRITSAGIVGMGATASGADLGVGLHIKTADSSASANANFDELVIEGSGATGLCILTPNNQTGGIAFGDDGDNDRGRIAYDHSNDRFFIDTNGNDVPAMFFHSSNALSTSGETAPDVGEGGITLDQNAGDLNILTFKSSDVAHGITDFAETDTYGQLLKTSAGSGGLKIQAFMETISAIALRSFHVNENTTQASSGSDAAILIDSCVKNGTTVTGNNDSANMVCFRDNTIPRVFICGDGDIFTDTNSFTAFDTYEDAQLVRALDLSVAPKTSIIDSKFDEFINYNAETLANVRILGKNEDGTPSSFLNIQGLQRLHNGAIWQQYEKHQKLANAMYELAKIAVGEEKANEILEQNEIQLLN